MVIQSLGLSPPLPRQLHRIDERPGTAGRLTFLTATPPLTATLPGDIAPPARADIETVGRPVRATFSDRGETGTFRALFSRVGVAYHSWERGAVRSRPPRRPARSLYHRRMCENEAVSPTSNATVPHDTALELGAALKSDVFSEESRARASTAAYIVSALESGGVRFVLPRNFELPAELSGDLDLWIAPRDLHRAAEVVLGTARDLGWSLVSRWELPRHLQYAFYRDTGPKTEPVGLAVDLEAEIGHKGFRYAPIEPFLENPRRDEPFPRPRREGEAVGLALHSVLSKEALSSRYRERLATYELDGFSGFARTTLPESVASELIRWVGGGAPEGGLASLAARLRRKLAILRPANMLRPAFVRLLAWSRFLKPREGLLLALVGPDGSGKSTISSLVQRKLPRLPTPVDSVYMGKKKVVLPTSRLIRLLSTHLGDTSFVPGPPPTGNDTCDREETASEDADLSLVSRAADVMGLLNWLAEQWYRYLTEIRPVLQQGGVVLTDRYFVDFIQRPEFSVAHRPLVRRLLIRLFPEPDLAVLLWADPAVLAARKPEYDPKQGAIMLRRFRSTLQHYDGSLEIRTDVGAASATATEIAREVLNAMAGRYRG